MKPEKEIKKVAPMKATNAQICRMRRDSCDYRNFSLMCDGWTVWLSEQAVGADPTQRFKLTKGEFNHLIEWYTKPAKLSADPGKKEKP